MKSKVIIENGKTEIVLTPDNDFEKDVILKARNSDANLTIVAEKEYSFGEHKYSFIIRLIEPNE